MNRDDTTRGHGGGPYGQDHGDGGDGTRVRHPADSYRRAGAGDIVPRPDGDPAMPSRGTPDGGSGGGDSPHTRILIPEPRRGSDGRPRTTRGHRVVLIMVTSLLLVAVLVVVVLVETRPSGQPSANSARSPAAGAPSPPAPSQSPTQPGPDTSGSPGTSPGPGSSVSPGPNGGTGPGGAGPGGINLADLSPLSENYASEPTTARSRWVPPPTRTASASPAMAPQAPMLSTTSAATRT